MSRDGSKLLDTVFYQRVLRRWARAARLAKHADLDDLRRQRTRARSLKTHLDALIHTADDRIALPVAGSDRFSVPFNADWAWRPELWRVALACPGFSAVETKTQISEQLKIFHDCNLSEVTVRQVRNARPEDLAPYGLRTDVFRFDGSFLSLVLELPLDATEALSRDHVLRMDTIVELESPLEIFARLNVKNGPNTEQIVRELPLHETEVMVEFDMAYSKLNERRVERAWVDIIFESPEMNQITLRDVTFSRRPRAAL